MRDFYSGGRSTMARMVSDKVLVIDMDDRESQVGLHLAVHYHLVTVRHSRKENYIAVEGETYPIKDEIKKLGFRWDSGRKRWISNFNEIKLRKIIELAQNYIDNHPRAKGLVQCRRCGDWFKPRGKISWDGAGWYCGKC